MKLCTILRHLKRLLPGKSRNLLHKSRSDAHGLILVKELLDIKIIIIKKNLG